MPGQLKLYTRVLLRFYARSSWRRNRSLCNHIAYSAGPLLSSVQMTLACKNYIALLSFALRWVYFFPSAIVNDAKLVEEKKKSGKNLIYNPLLNVHWTDDRPAGNIVVCRYRTDPSYGDGGGEMPNERKSRSNNPMNNNLFDIKHINTGKIDYYFFIDKYFDDEIVFVRN